MCTLILAWRVFEGTPIAAAANRDEALGRPSRPPGVIDSEPEVVAPRDEEAGGTWIGYNDAGLFVAVTNRRAEVEGGRSRGLLVRDALARESAREAVSFVRSELAGTDYAGFNLVVADADDAALLAWDGVLRETRFDPGVHVVVNEGHDADAPKAERIREAVRPDPETDAEEWFERAGAVLRDHDLDACVHGEAFGTRSSSLVAIDADRGGRYWFAEGRPCETDYEAVAVGGEDGHI
ncbi:NRDE family protein [Halorussus salilacus]|uniref:NRDE family protein n=1 Tax=Halorussus salilacus TaxID=2953750 RepID=UPI0020A0D6E3|nr:NRDE family protein [Halorussus salilacus]USZ68466.1 NRDE family protein [Halorussus salilacus]